MHPTRSFLVIAIVAMEAIFSGIHHVSAAPPRLVPFQGRLTDASGAPIADGPKIVQFKIYDTPTGGGAVWNGEIQMLTVNGGLVSTLLGSKADLSTVDFNQALYLEITVDANGDNQITDADPPLLPRQSVLPAVFAVEAYIARNAKKLKASDGSFHDWSALFGAQNPSSGTIPINRVAIGDGSIAPTAISATAGLTASQLAPDSVDSSKIRDGSVTSAKILDGEVRTSDLAAGAVTSAKLAPLNYAISVSCGDYSLSGPFTPVPNRTAAITTTGRPVRIGLVHDGGVNEGQIIAASGYTAYFQIQRDGVVIGRYFVASSRVPSSSIQFFDVPVPAGAHTYTNLGSGTPSFTSINNTRLWVVEL